MGDDLKENWLGLSYAKLPANLLTYQAAYQSSKLAVYIFLYLPLLGGGDVIIPCLGGRYRQNNVFFKPPTPTSNCIVITNFLCVSLSQL